MYAVFVKFCFQNCFGTCKNALNVKIGANSRNICMIYVTMYMEAMHVYTRSDEHNNFHVKLN